MNLVEGWSVGRHHTFLQELTLADGHGANRINGLHALLDFVLKFSVKQSSLNVRVGVLGREGNDDLSSTGSHVLLDRGLNALLRYDQRLHSNEVPVGCHHVNNVVNLSSVATNLATGVVGLMMVPDERRQGVLAHTLRDTESHHDVHF